MPWGEVLPRFSMVISPWNLMFVLLIFTILIWATSRSVILWRTGERRTASFLFAYLALQIVTVSFGALIAARPPAGNGL